MSAIIGALRAVMSLESAAFQKGLTSAEKSLRQFQKSAQRVGKDMQRVGVNLSAAVTAPLAAVAAGVRQSTGALVELDNQARLAGTTAQQLKVMSLAAQQFGIDQEKLADVLKDVNDKFGDYAATGQGPLKDFFETIAPQVGLTADAFRELSSDQALGLYVKSLQDAGVNQQQMTFFMEALASDATALLPVFADNSKALQDMQARTKALGLSIDQELLANARETKQEFAVLSQVLSLQMQEALVQLAPAITKMAQALGPAIEKLAGFIERVADGFANLSPETQGMVVKMSLFAAAIGPVVAGLGVLVSAIGAIAPALAGVAAVLAANPITLTLGAIAAAGYLIWQNWDGIKEFFVDLFTTISTFASQAWETIRVEVTSWPARLRQLGADAWQGLIEGIAGKFGELRDTVAGAAGAIVGRFKEVLAIESPSKVMIEIGQNIMDGLQIGMEAGQAGIQSTATDLANVMTGLENRVSNGLHGILTDAQSASDALKSIVSGIASDLLRIGVRSVVGGLFGGVLPFAKGGVVPFAKGGVVNAPTAFAMPSGLGVMGEAGAEAILPLARGPDGVLGVRGGGNISAPVHVHIDARGAIDGVANEVNRALARQIPQIQRAAVVGVKDAQRRGY
ncbi:MAG: hypothetical protein AAFO80_12555 [Pseudomonadota bacterium]